MVCHSTDTTCIEHNDANLSKIDNLYAANIVHIQKKSNGKVCHSFFGLIDGLSGQIFCKPDHTSCTSKLQQTEPNTAQIQYEYTTNTNTTQIQEEYRTNTNTAKIQYEYTINTAHMETNTVQAGGRLS